MDACSVVLTINRREPQNDAVQPFRGEGTNGAEQTQHEYCEKHSLMCISAVRFSMCRLLIDRASHGVKVASPPSKVCMTAVAKII